MRTKVESKLTQIILAGTTPGGAKQRPPRRYMQSDEMAESYTELDELQRVIDSYYYSRELYPTYGADGKMKPLPRIRTIAFAD